VPARTVRDMNLNFGGVTIDCENPTKLAEFWQQALGLEVAFDADGEFIQLHNPANPQQPYLGLQKVPEKRGGKNRAHIDFATEDAPAELKRLESLGATIGETHEMPGLTWTVLQDPEGNEFCVGTAHG